VPWFDGGAAACRSCVCDDNTTEGGCCRQDRCWLGRQKRAELLGLLRGCFSRVEPWLQAGKYVSALAGDLPRRNGSTIAQQAGDSTPQRTQRLLNRAAWDTFAAMGVVHRFAVAGLDEAARRSGRRRGLAAGAIDETTQVKRGCATAGVKRQYLGCVGKVANGITTVHLSYVRERTGHALIGGRQWIPAGHPGDPAKRQIMGLPKDLVFRTKAELAIDIRTEALAGGTAIDFVCGERGLWRLHQAADKHPPLAGPLRRAWAPRGSAGMPGPWWPPPALITIC